VSREVYIERSFRGAAREIIDRANAIIAEYQAASYRLTLRQLYYQFVARGLLPNTLASYKLLGRTMVWARDTGESDWDAVEDRTREVNNHAAWSDPDDFLESVVPQYAEDWWRDQHHRPEVWIEKDALLGVIAPVCRRFRIPYFSTRGNVGQLAARDSGRRFADQLSLGQLPIVLHLADHDPTGIEMTVDLEGRLERYAREPVEVRRVALTMSQVRRHRPPPNFVKEQDVNTAKYRREFGTDQCWELDALAPDVIAGLIEREIEKMIDEPAMAKAKRREQKNLRRLKRLEVAR
jgi:hypothetical protein